jgi:hypothetical protein
MIKIPTLHDATPYPEGPRYFVRDWNLARSTVTPCATRTTGSAASARPSNCFAATPGVVRIYRYSCRSPHPEERALEDLLWARHKAFPAVCFSAVAPGGEYVFTPAAAVVEITLESLELELARITSAGS